MAIEEHVEIHGFELKIKRDYRPNKDVYEYICYWHMLDKNLIRLDVDIPSETIEDFEGFNPSTLVPDELEHVYRYLIIDLQEILFVSIMANTNKERLGVFNPIITPESLADVKLLYNL